MIGHQKLTKKLIASSIALVLSASVIATESNYDHFEHGEIVYQNVGMKETNFVKTNAKRSEQKVSTQLSGENFPTLAAMSALTGDALIEYIVSHDSVNGDEALPFYRYSEGTAALYTQANMITLGNAITSRSGAYSADDGQGLEQLFNITRAAFYIEIGQAGAFDWDLDTINDSMVDAIDAFTTNSLFLTDTSYDHQNTVLEFVAFVNNVSWNTPQISADNVPVLVSLANTFPRNEDDTDSLRILTEIHRVVSHGAEYDVFKDAMNAQANLAEVFSRLVGDLAYLQTWGNGDNIAAGQYKDIHTQAIFELGRLMNYSNHFDAAEAATVAILSDYDKFSAPWMAAFNNIQYYSDCTKFENICAADVRDEMMAHAFPNTYSFDNGNFIVRTAISESEAQELYHAAKQVEAQYKRQAQTLVATETDPNESLTMFVYGTRGDYDDFQGNLFELSTDNGGIYIEQWGQFFTYQRTAQESIYTLEELFRHEYVHYLNGRYAIDGMWGEAEFYANDRLNWWDEGMAEFLASSTQSEGVPVRKIMVQDIAADAERMTIADVVAATYEGGFKFYRYSALFFNYMNEYQPEAITQLNKLGQAGDIEGFDELVAELAGDTGLQASYDAYLDTQIAQLDSMTDFAKISVPQLDLLTANNADDIQVAIRAELSDATCSIASTDMNHRFVCTGSVTDTSIEDINYTLNSAIDALKVSDVNNFETMNCAYGTVTDMTTTYSCEGALRNVGVDLPVNNTAPVAEAGNTQTVDEGTSVTLSGSGTDAEGDTLTYSWVQTGGTSATLTDADTATATFIAPEVSANTTLTFELSVTDGEFTTTDTVTTTVNNTTTNNGGTLGNAASNESKGGGGSMGVLSAFGMLLLAFRRKANSAK